MGDLVIRWRPGVIDTIPRAIQARWTPEGGVVATVLRGEGLPVLLVDDGSDEPWELGCPICNYREYQERQQKRGLEVIDGVGPKTAEKLEAVGISDVSDLTDAEADDVADQVEGVSADKVREWQAKVGKA